MAGWQQRHVIRLRGGGLKATPAAGWLVGALRCLLVGESGGLGARPRWPLACQSPWPFRALRCAVLQASPLRLLLLLERRASDIGWEGAEIYRCSVQRATASQGPRAINQGLAVWGRACGGPAKHTVGAVKKRYQFIASPFFPLLFF